MNQAGTRIVSYTYDAWGNLLNTTTSGTTNANNLANNNPLRYRGYIYDNESGLYYLQSRYYDPEIGRFINADALVSTGQEILGNNMFAYCGNSPIYYSDPSGCYRTDTYAKPMLYGGGGKNKNVIVYPRDSHDQIVGLINGQGIFEFADEGVGLGSYASSGCAFIAIYNALQLLSKPQSLGSIRDEFLYEHGTLLGGAAGAGPWQFDSYFDKHNISYTGYGNYDDLIANLQDGDVIVFTIQNNIWNPFMYHTMAAQYQNGYFIVYNVSNKYGSSYTTTSLLNMYAAGTSGWIYGYNLGG